jgi:hypothetical protein
MEYDPERGDVVFYRKQGRIVLSPGAGLAVVAVIVFLTVVLVGRWALNCYGSQGRLEFHSSGWFSLGRTSILGFDVTGFGINGYSTGLMWLQEGQSVAVTYEDQGEESSYEDAKVWFGPLEDWAWKRYAITFSPSGSLLKIRNGSGSRVFAASKTGFHVLCYHTWRDPGRTYADFTITWRVLGEREGGS